MKNSNLIWFDGYKVPEPLTKEETDNLFQEFKNGSLEARETLITYNLRLVFYIVNKDFRNVEYDRQDLMSIGIMGLIKAVDSFSLDKNISFVTYASRCIDNEIFCFLRQLKKYQVVDSLDKTIAYRKDGGEIKLGDTLADSKDLIELSERKEVLKAIKEIVETLPNREKMIIMLNFGLLDGKVHHRKEIAHRFNISQSWVSNIINTSIGKIAQKLKGVELIEVQSKKLKYNPKTYTYIDKKKYQEILAAIKEPTFLEMLPSFGPETELIFSMVIKQVNESSFDAKEIAKAMGVARRKVLLTIKAVLAKYQKEMSCSAKK